MSQPVLTLSPPGAQAAEGEVVTLHCKVPRGSFPITYQLYHEGVPLKKEEGSAQRAMPFRLPLTAERSGHYFCSADNGFGPRCSEAVGLSVIGESVLDSGRSLMPDPIPLTLTCTYSPVSNRPNAPLGSILMDQPSGRGCGKGVSVLIQTAFHQMNVFSQIIFLHPLCSVPKPIFKNLMHRSISYFPTSTVKWTNSGQVLNFSKKFPRSCFASWFQGGWR